MAKKGEATRNPMALYRAYRPQSFAEVRGQGQIVSVLEAAVKNDKVAHAYLFAGGRGTGKTSMARILARALKTDEQDIYEMDAASNRGIDEVRQLREGVATLPFSSTYKFYIIDEAHALTRDAWGAFLKTLEEPPEHAIFVLCTTELDKVPDTVRSRCQIFNFNKPSHEILKKMVIDIAKSEGTTIEPAAAELVALMGEGSFRDTLGILQKVLTISSDKKLTEEEVAKVVGAPQGRLINDFLVALGDKDMEAAIGVLQQATAAGADSKLFCLLVVTRVRGVLLLRFAPKLKAELQEQFGDDDLATLEGLAKNAPAINAALLAELLTALVEMNRAPLPHVPLELALYRALA